MRDDRVKLGFILNASMELKLLEEGKQLVEQSSKDNASSVLPALAVLLASAALEVSIERALKLAQAWSRNGGTAVGFPYDVSLEDIDDAFTKSLRWKAEHVPALITNHALGTEEIAPGVLATLKELVDCRNQLVHGRGAIAEYEAHVELRDSGHDETVAGDPVADAAGSSVANEVFDVQLTKDTLVVRAPIPPPWGQLWFKISPDKARSFLDAVSTFIERCIEPAEKPRP